MIWKKQLEASSPWPSPWPSPWSSAWLNTRCDGAHSPLASAHQCVWAALINPLSHQFAALSPPDKWSPTAVSPAGPGPASRYLHKNTIVQPLAATSHDTDVGCGVDTGGGEVTWRIAHHNNHNNGGTHYSDTLIPSPDPDLWHDPDNWCKVPAISTILCCLKVWK